MGEPWVVTYETEHRGDELITRSTDEFYRGDKAECERIARHSASPTTTSDGHKITMFKVVIGPAADWDKFLREWAEMEA
jgi:hypothetical protein